MKEVQIKDVKDRIKKVSSILVSQPQPKNENSPYYTLEKRYGVNVDFKSFIKIESVPVKEFKKQKINLENYTAVIFTSRKAVDNYFNILKSLKIEASPDTKYFCISEQTANYLQKYIVVRKRKLFTGVKSAKDLLPLMKKHKKEKFVYPCSNIRKDDIPDFLKNNNFDFDEAVLYRTVSSNLSSIDLKHDIIAFFSPSGISSLFYNFPDFEQGAIRIAAFGPTTAKAVREAGLFLDIEAPLPNAPSMTGAIEAYIRQANEC